MLQLCAAPSRHGARPVDGVLNSRRLQPFGGAAPRLVCESAVVLRGYRELVNNV